MSVRNLTVEVIGPCRNGCRDLLHGIVGGQVRCSTKAYCFGCPISTRLSRGDFRVFPCRMSIDDPGHPANAVESIAAKFGVSKAFQGLKQAIHDIIDERSDLSGEKLRNVDATLASNGLLTFSEVRMRYWSKYRSVLKRGVIRNQTEFYLLKGIADNLGMPVPKEERSKIDAMLSSYESRGV